MVEKIVILKCSECGKEIRSLEGSNWFGILCFKCSQKSNKVSKDKIDD